MKSKILIPVMAFVFAIGMSFTTEKPVATAYIDDGNNVGIPVMVTGCGNDLQEQCTGQIDGQGPEIPLYQDAGLSDKLMGGGTIATITF